MERLISYDLKNTSIIRPVRIKLTRLQVQVVMQHLRFLEGRLDVKKINQMEDLTGLTERQLELLDSIEALQSQNTIDSRESNSEEESLNEIKPATSTAVSDSHHTSHVDNEVRYLITELMESFDLCPVSNALSESVRFGSFVS